MKVSDLKQEKIVIGLKIKSLCNDKIGTIVKIDNEHGDIYNWVSWDGAEATSGFWDNVCDNEIIEET